MGNSLFDGGKITIELANNIDTFLPGQMVCGTLHVDQVKPYEATKLMISLIGSEHAFFDESNDKQRVEYRSDQIMHRVDFDMLDLGPYQNQCQIGKFQFPFQF